MSKKAKKPKAPKAATAKPPNPSRAEIKPQVDDVLNGACAHAGNPTHPKPIGDSKSIEDDLLIGPNTKAGLAVPYTKISLQYQGGRPVSIAAAAACDTVGDAVGLVHKRANGT
jgi:hypothetical protein